MKNLDDKIERALTHEPDFRLPDGFAQRLVSMIEASNRRERNLEIFMIGFGSLLFLIALIAAIVITDFKLALPGFSFIASHAGPIFFGILFIIALNILDKRLIQPKIH
jgi:hypothetical protein